MTKISKKYVLMIVLFLGTTLVFTSKVIGQSSVMDSIFTPNFQFNKSLVLFGENHVININGIIEENVFDNYLKNTCLTHYFCELSADILSIIKSKISAGDTANIARLFVLNGEKEFWQYIAKRYYKSHYDSIPIYGIDIIDKPNYGLFEAINILDQIENNLVKQLKFRLSKFLFHPNRINRKKVFDEFNLIRNELKQLNPNAFYLIDLCYRQFEIKKNGKIKDVIRREALMTQNILFWYSTDSIVRGFCSMGRYHVSSKEISMKYFNYRFWGNHSLSKMAQPLYSQLEENDSFINNTLLTSYVLAYCFSNYQDCSKWPRDNIFGVHPNSIENFKISRNDNNWYKTGYPKYENAIKIITPNRDSLIIEQISFPPE